MRRRAGSRNPHGGRLRGALLAARWPDRNPLRRTVDWIELVAMIALVAVFLAGAPAAAMATSTWAWQGAETAARLERATSRPVAAVILRGVPRPSSPYGAAYLRQVPVRWTLNGAPHTGTVEAVAGTSAGRTVRIWTTRAGAQTGPPLAPSQVAHQAALAGVLAVAGLALLVIVCALIIRRILDRRRMAAWGAEWSATGPQWSRYR